MSDLPDCGEEDEEDHGDRINPIPRCWHADEDYGFHPPPPLGWFVILRYVPPSPREANTVCLWVDLIWQLQKASFVLRNKLYLIARSPSGSRALVAHPSMVRLLRAHLDAFEGHEQECGCFDHHELAEPAYGKLLDRKWSRLRLPGRAALLQRNGLPVCKTACKSFQIPGVNSVQ